ncbi:signal recognition particle-docking protein FtsY [Treponema sp.]|uniref:signal recognition particle-docking protein FtsY n=1 Tax=Treponema sp. TaxID=166 RepID=UPI001B27E7C2|nr:signal recognition particle-docking protein FtsY [Treponema sp.]MBE6353564.1 signal recognition particle-docking protein FtsY [Treponema sp.]MBO6176678.1 signal recognition particle-docking protein FtsY [Treponema sp.]
MSKLSFGQKLKSLFGLYKGAGDDFFEELTDALIEGDLGAKTAVEVVDALEKKCRSEKISGEEAVAAELKQMLLSYIKSTDFMPEPSKVNVYMLLGVNGVGKTTTAAKMAKLYSEKGVNVVLSASDTFRAAAVDQISMHGEKLGIRVVRHQMGSDPSSVVFDACESVRASGGGLVIADTAGRLHNKENLVNELKKIDRVASSKADEGCYKKILVIDATTGQNAVRQAEVFHEAVGVDAVVITKYDSTAKGGEVVTIGKEFGIPVLFVCTGEKYENISGMNCEKYIDEFMTAKQV